ncbi:MAG TPA: hypothetical protein VFB13_16605 [Reyranella sp.]|nr:hypothetical protein [Reyranella sp.]
MIRSCALLLLLTLGVALCAGAQAADDEAVYTDSCSSRSDGSTRGQGLLIARSGETLTFTFQDFRGYAPVPATGRIDGDKITFDAVVVGLPVHFTGTITPQEIKGRFSNPENDPRYNMDVRWPKLPPRAPMPFCP